MKRQAKRGAILLAALLFLVMGLVGSLLPFLPGFVFIAIGLILISIVSLTVHNYIERHTSRYPRFHKLITKLNTAVRKVVGEV